MQKYNLKPQEILIQRHLMQYFFTMADDVMQDDTLILIKSSVGDVYHNAVTFLAEEIDELQLEDLLSRTHDFFKRHKQAEFCIWDYSYNSIKDMLSKQYTMDPSFSGLFCELSSQPFELQLHPDISYKTVMTDSELDEFFIPFKAAFNFSNEVATGIKHYYQNNKDDSFIHYVAYHHDQPVAAASTLIYEQTAGLYNLSVLPEYRHQGIAKNLQKIRLNDALAKNIKKAIIQAVPITEVMTKNLDFKEYTKIVPLIYRG